MYKIEDWILLNNQIIDSDGNIKDLNKDKEATRSYFINYINNHTKFFHSLEEKIRFMTENEYWEKGFFEKFSFEDIKEVFERAYSYNFRFNSYMSAFKFYNDYALRDRENTEIFLERYEDRLSIVALYHSNGEKAVALSLIDSLMRQDFVPATPTLLNTGRVKRGELVSCFLTTVGDSLNDISRNLEFAMQLSKSGGGVALDLTNLRGFGESVKGNPNACKGVVGVAKLFDNAFRYADQMGMRQGAGAVYLNIFHSDIERFLQTKNINVDEDLRLKTLSIGVTIPDKFIEYAKADKDIYIFYPHSVYKEYGISFGDMAVDMNTWYDKLVENPRVLKKKISPRKLLSTIASIQGQSGYPYLLFLDNVNKENPFSYEMPVKFSNLCSEILQPSQTSHYADYNEREKDKIGLGISCNLASLHITNTIKNKTLKESVDNAMLILNSVSEKTSLKNIPDIERGNRLMRSVGLGAMDLAGFFAKNNIFWGSEEALDFVNVYFSQVNYYTLLWSNNKAKDTGNKFYNFEKTSYANGTYFDNKGEVLPRTEKVKKIFEGWDIPTEEDWKRLKENILKYGLYNSHRLAIAPTGSISYLMGATAGVTPIKEKVEQRTYGNSKTYFPMPYLENSEFSYETAYEIDKFFIIDTIAEIQKHIDQGISFEVCINSNLTTRDITRLQMYAHHKGIKTLYYIRTKKLKITECVSCSI